MVVAEDASTHVEGTHALRGDLTAAGFPPVLGRKIVPDSVWSSDGRFIFEIGVEWVLFDSDPDEWLLPGPTIRLMEAVSKTLDRRQFDSLPPGGRLYAEVGAARLRNGEHEQVPLPTAA